MGLLKDSYNKIQAGYRAIGMHFKRSIGAVNKRTVIIMKSAKNDLGENVFTNADIDNSRMGLGQIKEGQEKINIGKKGFKALVYFVNDDYPQFIGHSFEYTILGMIDLLKKQKHN